MKKLIHLLFIVFVSATAAVSASPFEGTWDLVSGEYVDGDGKLIDYKEVGMRSMKVIQGQHFSFVSIKGKDFWAAGAGSYKFDKKEYTEVLEHNSFNAKPGDSFSFQYKIKNDKWFNTRWDGDKRVEYEVWQKRK